MMPSFRSVDTLNRPADGLWIHLTVTIFEFSPLHELDAVELHLFVLTATVSERAVKPLETVIIFPRLSFSERGRDAQKPCCD